MRRRRGPAGSHRALAVGARKLARHAESVSRRGSFTGAVEDRAGWLELTDRLPRLGGKTGMEPR